MKLSRESEYGLKGMMLLAQMPVGTVMPLGDIAAADGLPRYFIAKIFRKLARHGVLRSFRGAIRGYALASRPAEISLREILEAIEGPELFRRCIFWSDRCDERNPCVLHDRWKEISGQLIDELMGQTLADLAKRKPSRVTAAQRSGRVA